MNMVSSDATVTWIPLDRDSWDFVVNLRLVWIEFCVGEWLSIWMGEMGYMLCNTGVPVPYRLGESVGRVLEDTVLYAGGTGAICL